MARQMNCVRGAEDVKGWRSTHENLAESISERAARRFSSRAYPVSLGALTPVPFASFATGSSAELVDVLSAYEAISGAGEEGSLEVRKARGEGLAGRRAVEERRSFKTGMGSRRHTVFRAIKSCCKE